MLDLRTPQDSLAEGLRGIEGHVTRMLPRRMAGWFQEGENGGMENQRMSALGSLPRVTVQGQAHPSKLTRARATDMAAVHGCRIRFRQLRAAVQRFTIYFARPMRTDAPCRTPRSRVASSVISPRILTGL